MIEAFTTYTNILNHTYRFNIDTFTLISPLDQIIGYQKLGFEIVADYFANSAAMIKHLME
jgi:hypothetical protein